MIDDDPRLSLPRLVRVDSQPFELTEPMTSTVRRFAHVPGTVGLLSGTDLDCANHHILGVFPRMVLESKNQNVTLAVDGKKQALSGDPFEILDQVARHFRRHGHDPNRTSVPLESGLLGYFSYDLKNHLERLPRASRDDLALPDLYLTLPGILLVIDRVTSRGSLFQPVFEGESSTETKTRRAAFFEELQRPNPPLATARGGALRSTFDRESYKQAVRQILAYIESGDVYQVNMSQRFETTFEGDAYSFFERLFEKNPAPFFAFVQAGDHQVLSTSPERFLSRRGNLIETRPIKGTRPRSPNPLEDAASSSDLRTNPKDDAELSMIVDLLRNDLGKVCTTGSVRVVEHKRVESYENVYHLVSIVRGELAKDQGCVDVLRGTFPGGSITGCPKIRAMEIIDELEPTTRHVYTGSIGYLGFEDTMDLSIAIRTATIAKGRVSYSVGGGIVYDSDPDSEFEETLHKGRTLRATLSLRPDPDTVAD